MPVYGPLIIGTEQFAEETVNEQVYGNNVYGSLVVGNPKLEKPAAAPAPATPETDDPMALLQAGAIDRMHALLGESYSISEAEAGLLAHPDIWFDLALTELARVATAGARKGLVKSLLASEAREGDEAVRSQLSALI